jgi:4-hydroxy-4-methyl-2-oxoglutarate aldolase
MLHKAVDILQPGEVIVCDHAGYEEGPWGELLSISALARSCAGLVIDGYVRDGAAIQERGFSVFARGLSIKGTVKESLGLINHPISCAGVIVHPGDLILGDADSVCVVERERAEEILQLSQERDQKELKQAKLLQEGKTIWQLSNFDELARAKGLLEEPLELNN